MKQVPFYADELPRIRFRPCAWWPYYEGPPYPRLGYDNPWTKERDTLLIQMWNAAANDLEWMLATWPYAHSGALVRLCWWWRLQNGMATRSQSRALQQSCWRRSHLARIDATLPTDPPRGVWIGSR